MHGIQKKLKKKEENIKILVIDILLRKTIFKKFLKEISQSELNQDVPSHILCIHVLFTSNITCIIDI